ncbi:hypothetical protein [Desulforamulus hydrothermalis]|nr:hypothetical protein [Desulforamulus hydrothermalis]
MQGRSLTGTLGKAAARFNIIHRRSAMLLKDCRETPLLGRKA